MFAREILFLKAVRTGNLRASKLSLHRRAYCEEKKSVFFINVTSSAAVAERTRQ